MINNQNRHYGENEKNKHLSKKHYTKIWRSSDSKPTKNRT